MRFSAFVFLFTAAAALMPSAVKAYETDPGKIPAHVQRIPYCSLFNRTNEKIRIPNRFTSKDVAYGPFRLVLLNATYLPSNLSNVINNVFPNISDTPIETFNISGTGNDIRGPAGFGFDWSFVVDVPYGNYINGHIVDAEGDVLSENAIYGLWVDKGKGKCDQSKLNQLPYDAASMTSGTPPTTSGLSHVSLTIAAGAVMLLVIV